MTAASASAATLTTVDNTMSLAPMERSTLERMCATR
jgi:hypothetical protein